MEKFNIKIDILPNLFLKEEKFNLEDSVKLCGKIAGVCYAKEGFEQLKNETEEKTMRRVHMTLDNGHHSVYDHVTINFNLHNVPKILAMVLNNEHQYTTSEKSARYTEIIRKENSIITKKEEKLYKKWMNIFQDKIKDKYGYIYQDNKIKKLSQENARYMVTVFMPTEMVYTTTLRQINYIASWMKRYIEKANREDDFERKLSLAMQEFINELKERNVLIKELMNNEKERDLSLFGKKLENKKDYFGDIYMTTYKGTFAELAQAHRHRTLDYKMEMLGEKEYFVPPILEEDNELVKEWKADIESVKDINPQGEMVLINEMGKYDDFILKCKERLCSSAQLEIMNQTRNTLMKYEKALEKEENPLAEDIKKYTRGARCTFKDFKCAEDCKFKEGKTLKRII